MLPVPAGSGFKSQSAELTQFQFDDDIVRPEGGVFGDTGHPKM